MTSFVVIFAAAWATLAAIVVAVLLAHDARQERRSRQAQSFPGWVNQPHLHLVGDEPHDAQILDFPGGFDYPGAGARR